jgi:hypothetical protein
VDFYIKIKNLLNLNCGNIRPTTLIIRTAHPYYVPNNDIVYWPPESSPLWTELLSELKIPGVEILLFPYIFDSFARSQWVNFAVNVTGNQSSTVWDGIYTFVDSWQKIDSRISGFMVDYEEITRYSDSGPFVYFTLDEVGQYKSLFPRIRSAVTIGYDDSKRIEYFDKFVDYLFLQAYDFYYPYIGSDATSDSIFIQYENQPDKLVSVIMSKILTNTILSLYEGKWAKIQLMWSTQTLTTTDCLYTTNSGTCGLNNEFGSWSPDSVNLFFQMLLAADPRMKQIRGHGLYTVNFLSNEWLPKNLRN